MFPSSKDLRTNFPNESAEISPLMIVWYLLSDLSTLGSTDFMTMSAPQRREAIASRPRANSIFLRFVVPTQFIQSYVLKSSVEPANWYNDSSDNELENNCGLGDRM